MMGGEGLRLMADEGLDGRVERTCEPGAKNVGQTDVERLSLALFASFVSCSVDQNRRAV